MDFFCFDTVLGLSVYVSACNLFTKMYLSTDMGTHFTLNDNLYHMYVKHTVSLYLFYFTIQQHKYAGPRRGVGGSRRLTQEPEIPGSMPCPATYFCFSFR